MEPRLEFTEEMAKNLPFGSLIFGYAKSIETNHKYICLSEDEQFIKDNNHLTAIAMKDILQAKFGKVSQKMLIIGWGKLTSELEKVLTEADISILNYNPQKVQELTQKYGDNAFFQTADFGSFEIIINTIPKQLITSMHLAKVTRNTHIFDLASAPFGFELTDADKMRLNYSIEPALPGRFYPKEAAKAVLDSITRYCEMQNQLPSIVLCITGSSCSYLKLMPIIKDLVKKYDVIPVLSTNANLPNRFVDIEKFRTDLRDICGKPLITTIAGSELLSSNKRIVASLVLPATGNTIAKLANAVTDTPVCMAVKALLRNAKPCIIGLSTNDALSGNAANIGILLNRKNYYFIPFSQDDPANKPFSMICDFAKAVETIDAALKGKQLQPIILA